MAKSKNTVSLIGYMSADPELSYTPSGTAKVRCRLGMPYDVNGEDESRWENITCIAWGKAAEILAQYTWKGRQVGFDGRLQTREWKDKDGNKRWTTEVVIRDFYLFGPAKDNGNAKEPKAGKAEESDVPTVGDDTPFDK